MNFKLVHSNNKYAPVGGTDFGFTTLKTGEYVILEESLARRVVEAGGSEHYEVIEDFDADAVISQEPAFVASPLTEEKLRDIKETYLDIVDLKLEQVRAATDKYGVDLNELSLEIPVEDIDTAETGKEEDVSAEEELEVEKAPEEIEETLVEPDTLLELVEPNVKPVTRRQRRQASK